MSLRMNYILKYDDFKHASIRGTTLFRWSYPSLVND